MFKRRILSFLIVLSLIAPFFYAPYQAKKAEAFLGFGDLVIDIKAMAERIIDGIAMTAAQMVVDRIVASTVEWARNGFEGGPAYVTDRDQYFTDLADGAIGQVIFNDKDLGFLCSPFRESVKVSLINSYYKPQPFQCTITGIGENLEDFYKDFTKGGWDMWFEMTQNPTNNPYGAYLQAKIETTARIAAVTNTKEKELEWNQGYLSWSKCEETNPPAWIETATQVQTGTTYVQAAYDPETGQETLSGRGVSVTGQTLASKSPNPKHIPGKAVGECIRRGPTQTPGTQIKAGLDKVLPSSLEKFISVEHVEQLINAVAAGLLQKYVFGPKGLFSRNNGPETGGGTGDIDGDGIVDGLDADGNGDLDTCYYGGADGNPTSKPCLGSSRAGQSSPAPSEAQCPIPSEPASVCQNVDSSTVLGILNKYRPSNAGITEAIVELNTIYPNARVMEHPVRLDKIDFGGGLIADVIVAAVGGEGEGTGWTFNVECSCGGPAAPVDMTP